MGMLKEFKEFAMRGNVIDLAVGVIIGAAFGKIVTSLVNDVVMPPIGKLMGNVNFSDLFVSLDPQKTEGITSLAKAELAVVEDASGKKLPGQLTAPGLLASKLAGDGVQRELHFILPELKAKATATFKATLTPDAKPAGYFILRRASSLVSVGRPWLAL